MISNFAAASATAQRLAYYQHLGLLFPVIEALIYTEYPRCHIGWIAKRIELWCMQHPGLQIDQGRHRIVRLLIHVDGEKRHFQVRWNPNHLELRVTTSRHPNTMFNIIGRWKPLYSLHNSGWIYPTIEKFCPMLEKYLGLVPL